LGGCLGGVGQAGGEGDGEGGEGLALVGDALGGFGGAGGVGELVAEGGGDFGLDVGVVEPGVVVFDEGFDAGGAGGVGELSEEGLRLMCQEAGHVSIVRYILWLKQGESGEMAGYFGGIGGADKGGDAGVESGRIPDQLQGR